MTASAIGGIIAAFLIGTICGFMAAAFCAAAAKGEHNTNVAEKEDDGNAKKEKD